jgi:hypothetical protein
MLNSVLSSLGAWSIFSFDLYAASTTVLVLELILLEKVAGRYRDKVWKVRGPRVVLRVAEEGRLQSIMQVLHETTRQA